MDPNPDINQNSYDNIKTIMRLFPYLKNKNLASKLLIDKDSIHYISIREYAEKISQIIALHLEMLNIEPKDAIITDATAGVGGDTISFAKNFKMIYSIEIDTNRAMFLKNNIDVYELSNVQIINEDCLQVLKKIEDHNVVFIDPPWENKESGSYKKYKNLRLFIGNESIENVCNLLIQGSENIKKNPDVIILKLPKNYDIAFFYKTVKKPIYYYDLNKMIILVIMVKYP